MKALKFLEDFPKSHGLCDYQEWKDKGLRVLPIENSLVFYISDELSQVEKIYCIISKKRDIENQLKDRVTFKE